MATEIILTLGQAFEVAYQLALKETSFRSPMDGNNVSGRISSASVLNCGGGGNDGGGGGSSSGSGSFSATPIN